MEKKLTKRILILLERYIKEEDNDSINVTSYVINDKTIIGYDNNNTVVVIPLLEFNLFMIDNNK